MALLETLMIDLGTSITKSILKIWLKADIASNASSSAVDTLKTWVTDRATQRRAQRQLEEIGEKVGESFLPIFERDGANLDDGSRTAIALAVAETLNTLSGKVLTQNNLDPAELAQYLWKHPTGTQHFNDTEILLFRRIISESCEYIVDIASQLPAVTEHAFAEVLKRENYLLDIAKQTLEEVQRMIKQADSHSEAQQFELKYRRAVIRELDSLELFGVDLPPASRKHRLSTAYISLSIEQQRPPETPSKKDIPQITSVDSHNKDAENRSTISVEIALANSHRLFIRGTAGSGKTTLLRWIAVNSARQSFKEPLTNWNKKLPFYISLRHCVEVGLPSPEDFPRFITTAILETMPKRWVHKALEAGQVVILVDGLDEVPELQREDVRIWLRDLVESYPKASYVVTSRPGAAGEDWAEWISREGFDDTELQPMDLHDIHAFIEHWHRAVSEELSDEEEKGKLPSIANHLMEEITSIRALRNLTTNPLLCAMVCALHRERREQLPTDRIKLYEVCCEMLIERRDRARRISLSDYPAAVLSYREKLVLLEDLAYWMINNGWSEVELQRAEEHFKRKLTNLHNIPQNISSLDVRRLFIERTALIQEPIIGYIDFTHRTFQEFLAAKAAINEEDIGVLVKNAQDVQWQEVIVLAAGLATKKVREELLRELIKRGDAEKKHRHQLHLLAISCLDTSVDLEPDIREEVRIRLAMLVPPNNVTDAKVLATAGELAVPYLFKKPNYSASISAFCIRSLALIGGDSALKAIAGYAKDTRWTVTRELLKAYDSFDQKSYAETVLKHITKIQEWPYLPLEELQYFPKLTELNLIGFHLREDLAYLANLTQLTTLNLSHCQISDLSSLANLTHLTTLNLGANSINDLSPLANLTQLTTLDLSSCRKISHLKSLANLTQLTTLDLSSCQISDLSSLANLTHLTTLNLGANSINDLSPLANLTQLTVLNLNACHINDLTPLANLTQLTTLGLWKCPEIEELTPLSNLTQLTTLNLSFCHISNLNPLTNLTQLTTLDLSFCHQISDLSPLANLTRLTKLDLSYCPQISDLSPLANLTRLTRLDFSGCKGVKDLGSLSDLRIQVIASSEQVGDLPVHSKFTVQYTLFPIDLQE